MRQLCVVACAKEGCELYAIQTNDKRITLVAGGYPLLQMAGLRSVSVLAAARKNKTAPLPNMLFQYLINLLKILMTNI